MQISYKCYIDSLKAGDEKRKEKIGEYFMHVYLNIKGFFVLFCFVVVFFFFPREDLGWEINNEKNYFAVTGIWIESTGLNLKNKLF